MLLSVTFWEHKTPHFLGAVTPRQTDPKWRN